MRISHQTKLVFQVFLDSPSDESYGFELASASGLPAGTIYPILRRLEEAGFVTGRWEEIDESEHGRRRRRYYRLTGEGRRKAREATAKEAPALRQLVPGWSAR
ncbi:MAG: PadR family transcriptional regulator [Actinomycetota bacterium]|nr:PadR family transcriptional regulator [Actinomycetota bacterium]